MDGNERFAQVCEGIVARLDPRCFGPPLGIPREWLMRLADESKVAGFNCPLEIDDDGYDPPDRDAQWKDVRRIGWVHVLDCAGIKTSVKLWDFEQCLVPLKCPYEESVALIRHALSEWAAYARLRTTDVTSDISQPPAKLLTRAYIAEPCGIPGDATPRKRWMKELERVRKLGHSSSTLPPSVSEPGENE